MDSGPGVVTWVRTRVCANAPDNELVGVRRSFKDVGVVTVKTALQLDDGCSARFEADSVVVAIGFASGFPVVDEPLILHVVENMLDELSLVAHRGGELSANALDCAPEYTAAVEFRLAQAMIAKRMRLGLQGLGERLDLLSKAAVPLAWDDAHAAWRASVACKTTGSMSASAKKRTTGTTTPSPVR